MRIKPDFKPISIVNRHRVTSNQNTPSNSKEMMMPSSIQRQFEMLQSSNDSLVAIQQYNSATQSKKFYFSGFDEPTQPSKKGPKKENKDKKRKINNKHSNGPNDSADLTSTNAAAKIYQTA